MVHVEDMLLDRVIGPCLGTLELGVLGWELWALLVIAEGRTNWQAMVVEGEEEPAVELLRLSPCSLRLLAAEGEMTPLCLLECPMGGDMMVGRWAGL